MWKEKLPESCPPDNSEELDMEVYRILKESIPNSEDFVPYVKLHSDNKRYLNLCKAYALSSFDTKENAIKAKIKAEKRGNNIGEYIAKIQIHENVGLNKITQKNGHISTWLYSTDNSYNEFNCYDICKIDGN